MFGANSLLLLMLCCLDLSQALDQHLICKSVPDIFNPVDNRMRTDRGISRGVPGKRGAPGLRGIDGPRGRPGIVDYERVNTTIDGKLQSVISSFCEMERSIEEKMENMVVQLTSKMESLSRQNSVQIRGLCDVWYNNSYFWAIFDMTHQFEKSEAESFCKNNGARVADIYDENHYSRLLPYLRTKNLATQQHCFRLGLTYDFSANVVRRQSGDERFARWHPGGPDETTSRTNIAIWVHPNPTDRRQGFFNYKLTAKCPGVVCEIQGV